MDYPLKIRFKLFALAPQIFVEDANGKTVCYVKQKLFKLKEAVNVFTDSSQQTTLCQIKADRIIDFSANYRFFDSSGESFGSIRRKGMRSLWKAHYEILDESGKVEATISEENPMAKVMDGLLGEIPFLGLLTGFMFHPRYALTDSGGQLRMRMTKKRAFFEGRYDLERMFDYDDVAELRGLMGFMMMALLERRRG
jgi:uncharacterized protein YxjI